MSIGLFTDKHNQPTGDEIRAAIGARLPLWDALVAAIRAGFACDEDWHYMYGRRYGWALRFRCRGQLLTNLYPAADGFTAQVNLGPEAVEQAMALDPGDAVREAIDRATPYPEARWLFVPVATEADLNGVLHLVRLRAATKRIPSTLSP